MGMGRVLGILGFAASCAWGAPAAKTDIVDPASGLRAELVKVRATPAKAERWIDEARLLFYLAENSPEPEQMALFTEGRDLAQKARTEQPKNPAALLWWTANHGGIARMKKNLWALGALKDIEAALLEMKTLDPKFGYAAAARVLGKIYLEAPGFISIGSSSKAKENILESLKADPEFPGNELGYAEWLLEDGEKQKASEIVKALRNKGSIDKGEYGDFGWERPLWQRRFEELQKKTQTLP